MGGTYARYIIKHNPQIKFIISLDSSFHLEFNHKVDITDTFIDHTEDIMCEYNSIETGDIAQNELAFFYEEDKNLKPHKYKIKEIKKNYFKIYSFNYCHTLHRKEKVAKKILSKIFR
jgi:hypothetical protein